MLKKSFLFAFIFAVVALALVELASAQQPRRLPTNKELAARARSVYVATDTIYMKREALESSLLGKPEFKAWEMQITGKRDLADLVVNVKRIPLSNHFLYTVTDTGTDTIVIAGKVDSLAGTVYGQIAGEICDKLKVLRGDPLAAQESAPAPTAQASAQSRE
jgi:hypothetical protein